MIFIQKVKGPRSAISKRNDSVGFTFESQRYCFKSPFLLPRVPVSEGRDGCGVRDLKTDLSWEKGLTPALCAEGAPCRTRPLPHAAANTGKLYP